MSKKTEPTDEEKRIAKEKLERQKNATGKRGRSVILLSKEEDSEGKEVFREVANENEGIRTIADVKKWMETNNYIGTLYPVRIQKPITRGEQKVIKFS